MADIKDTFIIRTSWGDAIMELDTADQATMFRNLFAYHTGGDIELPTLGVKLVWKMMEPALHAAAKSYDKKRTQNRINGSMGGRPPKQETQINQTVTDNKPNNQTVITQKTQATPITLYDNVYDNDNVSVNDNDNENGIESADSHAHADDTPIEKIKKIPEQALPPPGSSSQQEIYYEQEICMGIGLTMPDIKLIHLAWIGDRYGQIFTTKEARINFRSYCAKWKSNNNARGHPPKNGAAPYKSSPHVEYTE
ncbi:MAG: DUF6291 domain-containing protein [Saprospiraceae bacterium]